MTFIFIEVIEPTKVNIVIQTVGLSLLTSRPEPTNQQAWAYWRRTSEHTHVDTQSYNILYYTSIAFLDRVCLHFLFYVTTIYWIESSIPLIYFSVQLYVMLQKTDINSSYIVYYTLIYYTFSKLSYTDEGNGAC